MNVKNLKTSNGQATTELLITAVTVLVPLFLLIPLLGKYIDINHATIQAARYEAWEYTVWYGNAAEQPTGFTDQSGNNLGLGQPVKSTANVQAESRRRFFSDTTLLLDDSDDSGWVLADRNPLWTDHKNNNILNPTGPLSAPDNVVQSSTATPDFFGLMNIVLDAVDIVSGIFSSIISFITGKPVGFTAINTNGYVTSTVTAQVLTDVELIDYPSLDEVTAQNPTFGQLTLPFSATAAVLTDTWNAGGLYHTRNQAGGFVPTKVLDTLIDSIPGATVAWQLFSILAPEIAPCPIPGKFNLLNYIPGFILNITDPDRDGAFWLGYLDIDAVHTDRLEGTWSGNTYPGTHQCTGDGMCDLTPVIGQSDCRG